MQDKKIRIINYLVQKIKESQAKLSQIKRQVYMIITMQHLIQVTVYII